LDRDRTARIEAAKAAVLAESEAEAAPSAELISSWRRSHAALGAPSNVRDIPRVADELLDSQLVETFRAPLQRFAGTLDGTGLALLLSDAGGRILECWANDSAAARHLDSVGTLRGSVLSEEAVGTNGVGTALAVGRLVQVRGPEHFADFYGRAVCTGAPVHHPVTGKLLGSVTLSCDISPRTELLRPLLQTVTAQLQQHVLDVEQPASRRALEAFLQTANSRTEPVVAIGPQGVMIQNGAASRLSGQEITQIREICQEIGPTSGSPRRVRTGHVAFEVSSPEPGHHVVVVLTPPAAPRSAPVRRDDGVTRLVGRAPGWLAVLRQVAQAREERSPVILVGAPGVGKVSVALGVPHVPGRVPAGHVVVDCAESHVVGAGAWLRDTANKIASGPAVCIRGAEALDRATVAALRSVLERGAPAAPVVTLSTADSDEATEFAVRIGGGRVVTVPSLSERAGDIPALWSAFAHLAAPGAGLVPHPDALPLLRAYRWPGNLTELRLLVGQLAAAGKRGPVGPADLPESLHTGDRALSLIEQVELRAIRQALQEAEGNRARAAEILGISRATVYRKMKSYHLTL
jgi:sigma-54 dependent transcriptional regulator, acetoin dehydrogenase operon transcriptional activator AcoR